MSQDMFETEPVNGPALAAILASAIGTFAMGALALLAEIGIFEAEGIYAPAGGLSSKAAITIVIWLIAWGVLHFLWQKRQMEHRNITIGALLLIGLGLLGAFPPTWGLFG